MQRQQETGSFVLSAGLLLTLAHPGGPPAVGNRSVGVGHPGAGSAELGPGLLGSLGAAAPLARRLGRRQRAPPGLRGGREAGRGRREAGTRSDTPRPSHKAPGSPGTRRAGFPVSVLGPACPGLQSGPVRRAGVPRCERSEHPHRTGPCAQGWRCCPRPCLDAPRALVGGGTPPPSVLLPRTLSSG